MIDCIVIGGGPAGLSAGINLKQRGKEALVLSSGESLLAKAEQVDNYLGMPTMTGREMMDTFASHAVQQGVEIRAAKAANIMPFDGNFMVNASGDILECRSIILATGIAKSKPIEGEAELLSRGVSYCATCDGMLYKDRAVAVWGLAPDAAHEANFLADIGCKVTFISGKKPDALSDEIRFVKGRAEKIVGDNIVAGVVAGDEMIAVDCVFILRNALPPDALLPGLTLKDGSVEINEKAQTSVPGVFAAGDLAGKPLQVAKAVGEGLIAALSCAEYLDKQA